MELRVFRAWRCSRMSLSTHLDASRHRRNVRIPKYSAWGPIVDGLYILIEGNVSDHESHVLNGEPAPGTACH